MQRPFAFVHTTCLFSSHTNSISNKMSWISFSAPSVDAEGLAKEIDSLSPERLEEVHRDLYGQDDPIAENADFLKHKLELLDQALTNAREAEHDMLKRAIQDLEHALSKVTATETENLLEDIQFPYTNCELLVEIFQRATFLQQIDSDTEDFYKRVDDARIALDEIAIVLFERVKDAFEQAQLLCPTYVNSDNFRLMFLRAEKFDENAAARRIILYWDEKVKIFGPDKAFRKISLDDFGPEDNRALNSGGVVLLPERDNAGRAITFSIRSKWDSRSDHRNSMLKLIWYVYHAAVEDEEVQRNGIVAIVTNTRAEVSVSSEEEDAAARTSASSQGWRGFLDSSLSSFFDRKLEASIGRILLNVMPVRFVAVHHVMRRKYISSIILPFNLFFMGPKLRARFRQHDGDDVDGYLAAFESYGMPLEVLPTEIGGTLLFDHEAWLQSRIDGNL